MNTLPRSAVGRRAVSNTVILGTGNSRQSGVKWSGWGGIEAAVTRAQLCFNIPNGVPFETQNPRQPSANLGLFYVNLTIPYQWRMVNFSDVVSAALGWELFFG